MGGKGSGRKQSKNSPAPKPDEKVYDEKTGEEIVEEHPPTPDPEPEPEPAQATTFSAEPEPEPEHPEEPRREPRAQSRRPYTKKKKRGSGSDDEGEPENISKLLLSVHQMLAAFVGLPELLLTQAEADKLGDAIAEVEALYSESSIVSPEIRAWANFGIAGVIVYWPRYKAIKIRLEKEAKEESDKDIDVTPINRGPATDAANMSRAGTGTIQN